MSILGIDFGTSTTLTALWKGGEPCLLDDADGLGSTPSVVAYLPDDRVRVGMGANMRRGIDPKNTIHSVKRILGRRWFDQEVVDYREATPASLVRGGDGLPRFETRRGELSPVEVATQQLNWIRHNRGFPNGELKNVLFCVPPSFGTDQVLALCLTARQAGFQRVGTIEEPYAAVIPFLPRLSGERKVLVYDLGGGTFDVAVLKLRGLSHHMVASGGDPFLGGDDLDLALAQVIADRCLAEHRWDLRSEPSVYSRLLVAAEKAKLGLSRLETITVRLDLIDPSLSGKSISLDRATFDRATHELIQRTFACCDEVLAEAGMKASEIDDVILAGGGSLLPSVRQGVEKYFGRRPLSESSPDQTVVRGACISAALQCGEIGTSLHGAA